ncbi:3'(2'),5'-bisphosphate nucleotidase CysQ [Halomonas rhizosphaerae]|uniref:3'(2'),5'-bisphosphate nucleotidase CysQ n=1 Tax=Halomonas rhizosphaerae TaxID=3043296 RepID=A0ABT6UZE2_9GAMM|nr:3'(2'),5'-bisphosphate nucleotidase CysQ [Halomonas rhizosphaerae]MDI5891331.1 3'(2'),5'-bisphosphate nucleotidase CysQ [Halomonas rhizosphaerae]
MRLDQDTIERLIAGVEAAGREVMAIYRREYAVEHKADDSPLTEADMAAHHALLALLARETPGIPVLSEESDQVSFATRRGWSRYWLVDPLDGTREFIAGNGEFTLNLALVEDGVPVFGIVHAPALPEGAVTWWGQVGQGAFRRGDKGEVAGEGQREGNGNSEQQIRVRELPDPAIEPWQVVGSRRNGREAFEVFCQALPAHATQSIGSSLKFCLIAEGKADLYPRLAPTHEWDTAAAQAIVTAAGGQVLEAETLCPLRCNQQESLLNPGFIACGQRDARWERALGAGAGQGAGGRPR